MFANAYLGFPSIHSVVLGINGDISPGWNQNGLDTALNLLSGASLQVTCAFTPMSRAAMNMGQLVCKIVGGNAMLVAALSGTSHYTLDTRNKLLFLESIADDPGEFSRKLTGLACSPLIGDCIGVIFGDIIQDGGSPNTPQVQTQFDCVIDRFAQLFSDTKIVLKADNLFGHGPLNLPLPLNTLGMFERSATGVTGTISANIV